MRKVHGHWHAGAAGAMRHVSTNPGRFGRRASPGHNGGGVRPQPGLPLLGGLMTIRELKQGHTHHALAMAIPDTRRGVWPARRPTETAT